MLNTLLVLSMFYCDILLGKQSIWYKERGGLRNMYVQVNVNIRK